ncbi:claudin-like protein ZF-A89 [Hoplias malabaricus]|uniref:claudin-like protein ZF-A89 n=1 Tax=Hoplias malabaricus TaxID=27720 RepID=UPI00346266B1
MVQTSAHVLSTSNRFLCQRLLFSRICVVMAGLQVFGAALALLGLLCDIVACALPMWKVTAFIGQNIVTAQIFWEGLWMNCVVQSTGQEQCKFYDSMLALPQDLQAARALTIFSIFFALVGLALAAFGGDCTNCVEDDTAKARVSVAAGVFLLLAGLLCLIPVCWSANTVITDFYNPQVLEAQKRELGASLFIGWAASGLLLFGGGLHCCRCPQKEYRGYSAKYTAPRSAAHSTGAYV